MYPAWLPETGDIFWICVSNRCNLARAAQSKIHPYYGIRPPCFIVRMLVPISKIILASDN